MDPAYAKADYMNASLPIEQRIEDLLCKMTIEEKARQMNMYEGRLFVDRMSDLSRTAAAEDAVFTPDRASTIVKNLGIGCIHDLYPPNAKLSNEIQAYVINESRLGIPVLFSEEALHGLSAPKNTILPQVISMASTYNRDLLKRAGDVIASETRSKGIHLVFNPVLEVARDPRWGRTEETFGEDELLATELALAMIEGMQKQDLCAPNAVLAEPKHFAAHSIPEGGLNCMPCSIGERQLRSDFLPPFRAAVQKGGVLSVMCAYHAIDGVPCAANGWLLKTVLRDEWGFEGFVCSDLGAIERLYSIHKVAKTPQDAIRMAVEAGIDMQFFDFDTAFFEQTIIEGVQQGSIAQHSVDRAVRGILRAKFTLGLFDRPFVDPSLSKKVTRSQRHEKVSLELAQQGCCLIKNDRRVLPLTRDEKTIAVIGPNADIPCLGDYTPPISGFTVPTLLQGMVAYAGKNTRIVYEKGCAIDESDRQTIESDCLLTPDQSEHGLHAAYYNDLAMQEPPVMERTDSVIDCNFIMQVPGAPVYTNTFCVRWTGWIIPEQSGEAVIGLTTTDGYRLWLDDTLMIDAWEKTRKIQAAHAVFEKGIPRAIRIDYIKRPGGGRAACLGWRFETEDMQKALEAVRQADVVVVALGESKDQSGESRDRCTLSLSGRQEELLEKAYAFGKPTVLVLQSGRPLAIEHTIRHCDACLQAWYPGDQGGIAMARILYGLYNPCGKLPISFMRTAGHLPAYYNRYHAGKRHYVDGDSTALFPFSHGLSYSRFEYADLTVDPKQGTTDTSFQVTATVTNHGPMAGYETVMLFIHDVYASVLTPDLRLADFSKVWLEPSETKTVHFTIEFEQLKLLDVHMVEVVEQGEFEISVGGGIDNLIQTTLRVI